MYLGSMFANARLKYQCCMCRKTAIMKHYAKVFKDDEFLKVSYPLCIVIF